MRKWKIKLIAKLRNQPVNFEIVKSREYFTPIDEHGNELPDTVNCNFRIRYCVREEGSTKIIKCFLTLQKAKDFIKEMDTESSKNQSSNS